VTCNLTTVRCEGTTRSESAGAITFPKGMRGKDGLLALLCPNIYQSVPRPGLKFGTVSTI
jgi:hypothetical protein